MTKQSIYDTEDTEPSPVFRTVPCLPFEIADSISEIKSICECGKKAMVNARFDGNGNIVTEGAQVDIGGNEKYKSMCWSCWQKLQNK